MLTLLKYYHTFETVAEKKELFQGFFIFRICKIEQNLNVFMLIQIIIIIIF